jgi:uncharacterized protein
MRPIGKAEMVDICFGGGVLGSGGGGSVHEGRMIIDRILNSGPSVDLLSVDEVDDQAWGAAVAGMGSPAASKDQPRTSSPKWALEALAGALGFSADFVVPFEVGAGNSLTPMQAAIQQGIPVVDADPIGRAVPQIHMTTFHLGGISLSPLALATEDGITAVIRSEDAHDMERVARAITSEFGGVAAIACYALQGRDLKRSAIPNTVTLSESIGAAIRQSREAGSDVATTLAEQFNGYILGRGTVSSVSSETRGGFDFGVVDISGSRPLTVTFQNENMVASSRGRVLATVPDLISAVDDTGTPVTNADITEGMKVAYVGFQANPAFRTSEAVALFSSVLSALGHEKEFIPIEQAMS